MFKLAGRIIRFYYDGFKNMTLGRTLWLIILIKLFVIFIILKVFLFPDFLNTRFKSESEKSDYVGQQLTKSRE
jgi:hypothetical protein